MYIRIKDLELLDLSEDDIEIYKKIWKKLGSAKKRG